MRSPAYLSSTTTCGGRTRGVQVRRNHPRTLGGWCLCAILDAKFGEYPFHALGCIRAKKEGRSVAAPALAVFYLLVLRDSLVVVATIVIGVVLAPVGSGH